MHTYQAHLYYEGKFLFDIQVQGETIKEAFLNAAEKLEYRLKDTKRVRETTIKLIKL